MNNFCDIKIISFLEKSFGYWCVKDINSNYVYVNKQGVNYYGFNKIDYEGKSDKEIPIARCQKLWPEFIKHDQKVIEKNKWISAIEIHDYNSKSSAKIIANYCEKTPLYDSENKIIGIVSHGIELDSVSLLHYMRKLNKKTIQFDAPNDIFTKTRVSHQ